MKLVYVLSTDNDMQFEREKLHSFVTEKVNEKLLPYKECLYLKDLSWKTNNDFSFFSNGNKLLSVALDEIEKCDRYMIVLIGSKYGFTPSEEVVSKILVTRGLNYRSEISLNELEIAYATYLNEEYSGKVFFYFRELDNAEMNSSEHMMYDASTDIERKRVDSLKRRLEESFPDKIRKYKVNFNGKTKELEGIDKFSFMVAQDLEETFERDIQLSFKKPYIEEIVKRSRNIFKDYDECYFPLKFKVLEEYKGLDFENNKRVTVISGDHGTGKSSYLSYLYFTTNGKKDDQYYKAVPFVLNSTVYSQKGFNVFKELIYAYEQNLSLPHKQFARDEVYDKEVLEYLYSLEREALEEREPFVSCMIDGATEEIIKGLHYLEIYAKKQRKDLHKFEGTRYYLVFNESKDIPAVVPFYNYSNRVTMPKLKEKDINDIIETISNYEGININKNLITAISKKEKIKNIFSLNLLIRYMLLPDYDNSIDGEPLKLLGNNMLDLIDVIAENPERLVKNYIEDVAKTINGPLVMRLLSLLAFSNDYLNDLEIENLFDTFNWEYSSLDIQVALKHLKPLLKFKYCEHSYTFVSTDIKKYVKAFVLEHNYQNIIALLVDYSLNQDFNNHLFYKCFRIASEKEDASFMVETFRNVLLKMNEADNKDDIRNAIASSFVDIIDEGNYVTLVRFMMSLAESFPSKEFSFLYSKLPTEFKNEKMARQYFEFYTSIENKFENKINQGYHFIDFAFLIMMTKLLEYYSSRNVDDGFTLLNRNLENIKSLRGIDACFLDDYLGSVTHLLNKAGVHTLIQKHLGLNPLKAFILDNKSLKECPKKTYYQSIFRARVMVELVELYVQGEILNEATWSMLRDAINIYNEAHYEIKEIWEYAEPRDYICQIRAQFLAFQYLDFYRVDSFGSYDFATAFDFMEENSFIYPSMVDIINENDHLDLDVFRFNNPNNDLDFGDKHDDFYLMFNRNVIRNKGLYLTSGNNEDLVKVINSMTERLYYLSVNYDETNDSINVSKEILNIIFTYCKNTNFNIESLALMFNKILHCFDVLKENEEQEVIMLYVEQLRNYFIGAHLVTALTSYLFNWYVRNDEMLYQTALLELEESRKEKELDERFTLYYDYFENVLKELNE